MASKAFIFLGLAFLLFMAVSSSKAAAAYPPAYPPKGPPMKPPVGPPVMPIYGCTAPCEEYCEGHRKIRPCMKACTACCKQTKTNCVPLGYIKCRDWKSVVIHGEPTKCP